MSHPNPFAQNVPATEVPQQQPANASPNPFAQQQAAPAAPAAAPANPYVQQPVQTYAQQPVQTYAQQPVQQAPQGTGNPFAGPTPYSPPAGVSHMQHVATTYAQQQAPQQPAQQAGPPAQFGPATAPPPPSPSGGKGAKLPDMYGRLVIIFPHSVQTVPRNASFVTDEQRARGDVNQQRMTATIVVLDDGNGGMTPLAFGGNPHALGGRPHDQSAPLPYVRKGMWINQTKVIEQVSEYLPGRAAGGPNNSPGAAVGRLVKVGPQQNDAWYLTTPTEAEVGLANTYLNLVVQGQYPHPLAP
jgi:hypothetical protein